MSKFLDGMLDQYRRDRPGFEADARLYLEAKWKEFMSRMSPPSTMVPVFMTAMIMAGDPTKAEEWEKVWIDRCKKEYNNKLAELREDAPEDKP